MSGFLYEDPQEWFNFELQKAIEANVSEPTAMALATADLKGRPDIRTVLFKGWRNSGLSFFTNYHSPKAQTLLENPYAALNFFWPELAQQIRISGEVKKLSPKESDEYFATRPRLSQIGAWASDQSQRVQNYQELAAKVAQIEEKYKDQPVPRPPHWGGFYLIPLRFEFWFGQEGRLHERYIFEKTATKGHWEQYILSP